MRTIFLVLLIVAGTFASIESWKSCNYSTRQLKDQSDKHKTCTEWCNAVHGTAKKPYRGGCWMYNSGSYCLCVTFDEKVRPHFLD